MTRLQISRPPKWRFLREALFLAVAVVSVADPQTALACACGCGVFDVGTGKMMPTGVGGTAWLEYDFMNQNRNWSGTTSAPAAGNPDKQIETDFLTAGVEYMFDGEWGVEAEFPYWDRSFKTRTDFPNSGDVQAFDHAALGDVRLKGIYSGFSDDMSTGVTFGVKLPTGDFTDKHFDRDTSIGTGSTDVLLGAYHVGALPLGTAFNWFANAQVDIPVAIQENYRPGSEFDAAAGVYFDGWNVGTDGKISPLLQFIGAYRARDAGIAADPPDSGYTRLLISPGVEFDVNKVELYGDLELPVYQNVNGNQLTAPVLFKFIAGYRF